MLMTLLLSALTCPGTVVGATTSTADGQGRFQYELRLPDQPIALRSGPDVSRTWCLYLPGGLRLTKVRTFIGYDRGAVVEAALTVTARDYKLSSRSEHKETAANYDSMKTESVNFLTNGEPMPLAVYLVARTTNAQPTRIEVGVILDVERP